MLRLTGVTDSMGEGVSLLELVRTEIHGFQSRFELNADVEVLLSPKMTQNFALILHELLTNALEHRALLVPEGRATIQVNWQAPVLTFVWREQWAPAPAANGKSGFGSLLLGNFAKSFCQSVDAFYGPEGLRYTMKIQSDEIRCFVDRQVLAAE